MCVNLKIIFWRGRGEIVSKLNIYPCIDSICAARWEGKQGNVGEDILISAEESVMANFDFLSREEDIEDEDEVSLDYTLFGRST